MKSLQAGKLAVKIYDSRAEMGAAAAADVAACMRKLLETKETINMILPPRRRRTRYWRR